MEQEAVRTLNRDIVTCTRCRLALTRNNAVPGEGPGDSGLLFIGEAPAETRISREDRLSVVPVLFSKTSSLPSVWRGVMSLLPDLIKCRPPENRIPGRMKLLPVQDISTGRSTTSLRKLSSPWDAWRQNRFSPASGSAWTHRQYPWEDISHSDSPWGAGDHPGLPSRCHDPQPPAQGCCFRGFQDHWERCFGKRTEPGQEIPGTG